MNRNLKAWAFWPEIWFALILSFAISLVVIPGCAFIGGGQAPANTNEAILEAKAIAKAYALSIESLANRCVEGLQPNCRRYAITRADALSQLSQLDKVESDLRTAANVVATTGDPAAGGDVLVRIDSTLALVLTFLAAHQQE